MTGFTLNPDLANDWLIEIVFDSELGRGSLAHPVITMDWDPREPGQEDNIRRLLRLAQHDTAAVSTPSHMDVDIEPVDDGDDWGYRFLLEVRSPSPLTLASPARPISELGQDHTRGISAAIAVLAEAVQMANHLLGQLNAYIAEV